MPFNPYVRKVIWSFGIECHQYAGNTQLYISFSRSSSDSVEVLSHYLSAVLKQLPVSKLKVNLGKTKVNSGWED